MAPGTYKLTALREGYQPSTAVVVVPKDGSGSTQDFKLTPVAGAKSWEQQLSISTHPVLRHVVLRSHHVFALAVAGMLMCGVGGWVLLRLMQGRAAGLWGKPRREYELVATTNGLSV